MSRALTGSEPGLVAYYRLDDGSGNTARDATANARHATLGGSSADQSRWTGSGAPQSNVLWVAYADQGMDPATVTNVATYGLVASGGDGTFSDGNETDLSASLSSVVFAAAVQAAAIQLSTPLVDDYYRLSIQVDWNGDGAFDSTLPVTAAGTYSFTPAAPLSDATNQGPRVSTRRPQTVSCMTK